MTSGSPAVGAGRTRHFALSHCEAVASGAENITVGGDALWSRVRSRPSSGHAAHNVQHRLQPGAIGLCAGIPTLIRIRLVCEARHCSDPYVTRVDGVRPGIDSQELSFRNSVVVQSSGGLLRRPFQSRWRSASLWDLHCPPARLESLTDWQRRLTSAAFRARRSDTAGNLLAPLVS